MPELAMVREAALRPLGRSGWAFRGLLTLLSLIVLAGLAAFVIQLRGGLGAAGYDDHGFWGIYEANLVAFIGVSYGGALVSAILRLTQARWRAPITRLAEAMAVCSLMVGALFAIIHLGRPDRIWRLLVTPRASSPIVWDFVAVTSYLVATLIFLYLPLIPDIAVLRDRYAHRRGPRARIYRWLALGWRGLAAQRGRLEAGVTMIAILIIPLAVLVHSVLSWAFAVNSRPGWGSTIFAPYFVVAALYSGVGMVILVVAGFRRGYRLERFIGVRHFRYLAYLMLALDLLYLYFTFTEMLTEGYTLNEEITPILTAVLVGQYAPFFWLFVVGAGLIPLLLVALPMTRTVPGIVVAAALVVIGMWVKRLVIVVPAAAQPMIAGAWGTFHPTWVAIAITAGGAAAVPLLLMLFFKFFPILAIYEIEELAATPAPGPAELANAQRAGAEKGLVG
ncbi:MAG TPA: NrfD/PsrC family molybdoenzyme membrane anchor subunit [Nitrolancea sp.]|nr:NrfD/PsrC family molybdoenzyme membrane anchor subunit [Nitrolancea sp.]